MTSTAVSNIAAVPVGQIQTAGSARENVKTEEAGKAAFENILKKQPQMQQQKADTGVKTSQSDTGKDFEAAGWKKDKVITEATPQEAAQPVDPKTAAEFEEKLEQGIAKILEEETGITEEELQGAMETLRLTVLDLLMPENLVALVQEAQGVTDETELLLTLDLKGITGQVQELVTNLTEEAGISIDALKAMGMTEVNQPIEELPAMDAAAPVITQERQDDLPIPDESEQLQRQTIKPAENTAEEEAAPVTEGTVFKEASPKEERIRTEIAPQEETKEAPEEAVSAVPKEAETEAPKQDFTKDPGQNETSRQETAAQETLTRPLQNTATEKKEASFEATVQEVRQEAAQPQQVTEAAPETPEAPRPVVDPRNIMNQFTEFARTSITADTTSVEMHLNPANLGRVLVNVTEQQGNLAARITVTNQEVREAMEAQIANLRSALENAGMKVTEVEVTVASHEFERNLEEGNAPQTGEERQNGEEARQGSGRKNLNANELDQLSGLMTEEEQLAAQIMVDHGNTMDVHA